MSFAYRPTPVIVLSGKTVGDDHVPLRRLPAGTMSGYTPNLASPALNAIGRRTLKGDPWLISSGTMGKFVLGDDSTGLPDDFFSGIDMAPSLPTDSIGLPSNFFSGDSSGPLAPTPIISSPGAAPDLGISNLPTGSGLAIPLSTSAPAAPVAAAQPSAIQSTAAAGTSLLTSIANFFKPAPAKATPMTAAQPGVYNAYSAQPSWFSQATLLPGTPNSTVLFGGAAVLVLFAVLAGGKK